MPIKLAITFVDFQCCHLKKELKITSPIIQKVVWQKFENKKSEMYKIFIFSRRRLWNVTFFLKTLFKGSKSSSKMVEIDKFEKIYQNVLQISGHTNNLLFVLSIVLALVEPIIFKWYNFIFSNFQKLTHLNLLKLWKFEALSYSGEIPIKRKTNSFWNLGKNVCW